MTEPMFLAYQYIHASIGDQIEYGQLSVALAIAIDGSQTPRVASQLQPANITMLRTKRAAKGTAGQWPAQKASNGSA